MRRRGLRLMRAGVTARQDHPAAVTIDGDLHAVGDPPRCRTGAEYRRDAVLARHDRGVAQRAADVGDDATGHGEEGRVGRGRDRRDEDVARLHRGEVAWPEQQASRPLDASTAGTEPDECAGVVVSGLDRRHPPGPHPHYPALGKHRRGIRPTPTPPHFVAPGHLPHVRCRGGTGVDSRRQLNEFG